VKRFPPASLLSFLVLITIVVWAVLRAALTAGAGVLARTLGTAPELSPTTLLPLALAVSWIVLLDLTISRERIFVQNLGIAPLTVMGVACGTVVLCELVVLWLPHFHSALVGGG
jgi:hypothetical protein